MVRPRSFDPEAVLEIAREIFWTKGFQRTSLDDITSATNLTKPSLYAAFGDKNALFLQVLDRYHVMLVARAERKLAGGPSAREAIAGWLEGFVPSCSGSRGVRGCLSINAATDGVLDQTEIRDSIAQFNARLEELIRLRLEADRRQFSKDFDPKAAAFFIMTVYNGLMVMARQMPRPDSVKNTIAWAVTILA